MEVLLWDQHLQPVDAVGQYGAHGLAGLKQLAMLVDHHPVQRLCAADGALVRLQFPDQEPEQGRLAGAVRTDDADAVAPLHAKGEILQDRAVAAALRYILRIDDDLGLALAAFGRQPDDAARALQDRKSQRLNSS